MNSGIEAFDDVQRICRSCLCFSNNLIPLDKPYDHVINAEYETVESRQTIATMMTASGNVQIEPDDGLPQNVCINCFMSIRTTFLYQKMCKRSDIELREVFHRQSRLMDVTVKCEKSEEYQECDPLGEMDDLKPKQLGTVSASVMDDMSADDLDAITTQPIDDEELDEDNNQMRTPSPHRKGQEGKAKMKKCDILNTVESNNGVKCAQIRTLNGISIDKVSKKVIKCEVCSKVFKDRGALRRHAVVHSDVHNFDCDICKRQFKRRRDLCDHMQTHIEKPTHLCSVCGAEFISEFKLIIHMRSHTGERPFKCDKCDGVFSSRTTLIRHRGTHDTVKAFACDVCGKQFYRKDKFKLHMMAHNDIRPYKCDICNRGFTQPVLLRNHMHTHRGEKNHICGVCGAGFAKSIQLINHRTITDHIESVNK